MAIKAVDLVGAEPSIAVVNKHGKSLSDIEDRVDMLASTALKERESAPLSSKIHTPSMIQSVKKLSAIAGGSSTLPADVSTFVHSLPVQPLQSSYLPTLMSSSSALNMITGAVAAKESLKSYRDLKNIGADSLAKEALVSSAGAVAQSAAGAAIAASRPLSIISSIDNIASKPSSSSLIGRVNFFTGTVASGLFGIVALCFSYLSFSKIRSLFQLSASLKKECHAIDPKDIGSAEKVAKFFTEKKLKTSPNYVLEKLYSDCHGDISKVKETLKKTVSKQIHLWIKTFVKELKVAGRTDDVSYVVKNSEALADRIYGSMSSENTADLKDELGINKDSLDPKLKDLLLHLSPQELHGLKIATSHDEVKKLEELSATIGSSVATLAKQIQDQGLLDSLTSLREERQTLLEKLTEIEGKRDDIEVLCFKPGAVRPELIKQMQALDKEKIEKEKRLTSIDAKEKEITSTLQNLASSVQSAIKHSLIKSVFSFISCTVLTLSIGFSLAPLAGGALIASAVISLASSLLSFGVDGFDMLADRKDKSAPGKHDKHFIALSTILDIASVAAAIAVGSVFSLGIAPVAAAAIIGLCWTCMNIYSYLKTSQRERKWKEEHPTPQDLGKELQGADPSVLINENTLAYSMAIKLKKMPGFESLRIDPNATVGDLQKFCALKIKDLELQKQQSLSLEMLEIKNILK